MKDPVEALIVDMLEWIGPNSRPYAEVIEAWRTSCPRLPVWKEANVRGFIDHTRARHEARVSLTLLDSRYLRAALDGRRRPTSASARTSVGEGE
jgi:hypothetical protein